MIAYLKQAVQTPVMMDEAVSALQQMFED